MLILRPLTLAATVALLATLGVRGIAGKPQCCYAPGCTPVAGCTCTVVRTGGPYCKRVCTALCNEATNGCCEYTTCNCEYTPEGSCSQYNYGSVDTAVLIPDYFCRNGANEVPCLGTSNNACNW